MLVVIYFGIYVFIFIYFSCFDVKYLNKLKIKMYFY